jgi:adiponectin receptor
MYLYHGYTVGFRIRYLLIISIMGLACASVGIAAAAFGSPAFKKGARVAAYTVMAACSIPPLSQVWIEQTHDPVFRQTILRYAGCVAVAGYGALLYATGVPERLRPGTFDIFGASHQIFHICIVVCFVMFHVCNVHLWAVLSSHDADAGLLAQEPDTPAASFLQQQG